MAKLRDLFSPQNGRIDFIDGERGRPSRQSLQRQVGAQDTRLLPRAQNGEVFPDVVAITEQDTQETGRLTVPGSFETQQGRVGTKQGSGMSSGLEGEVLIGKRC